ncbi:MAG: hypothetical protein AAF718_06635 [Pseudomonadota bacterium]
MGYAIIVNERQQDPTLARALDDAGIEYLFLLNRLSNEQKDQMRANGGLTHYIVTITPRNFITGYQNTLAILDAESPDVEGTIRILALLGDTATPAATEQVAGIRQAVN